MILKPRWLRGEEYELETMITSGINTENEDATIVNFNFNMVRAKEMCVKIKDSDSCRCRKCLKNCNSKHFCNHKIKEAEREIKLYNFNMLHLNNYYCETELNVTFKHRTIVDSSKIVM